MAPYYKEIKNKQGQTPTVDESTIIKLVNRKVEGGVTYLRLTKHVEKPLNISVIPKEILVNEGAEYRKRSNEYQRANRQKKSKKTLCLDD